MSAAERSSSGARPGSRRARGLLLGVLIGLAGGLAAYLALGTGTTSRGPVASLACTSAAAPVRQVPPQELGPLREAVARVLPQRVGRLYEEGTVTSLDAWQDGDPAAPAVVRTARRPAGYEMRWWAPNNDDVVADVFSFSTAQQAAAFAAEAAGGTLPGTRPRNRRDGPPQARNLTWVNPDAFAEADVYVQRGTRVYRIADVPAGQVRGSSGQLDLSRTLATIDTLACLLPEAHCRRGSDKVVPA